MIIHMFYVEYVKVYCMDKPISIPLIDYIAPSDISTHMPTRISLFCSYPYVLFTLLQEICGLEIRCCTTKILEKKLLFLST